MALCTEQGFTNFLGQATIYHGWALAEQGQTEEGIAQLRQGLEACRATGAVLFQPFFRALLAEAYVIAGQTEAGLSVVAAAQAVANDTGERVYEAELYRLKGELLLNDERRMMNDE